MFTFHHKVVIYFSLQCAFFFSIFKKIISNVIENNHYAAIHQNMRTIDLQEEEERTAEENV